MTDRRRAPRGGRRASDREGRHPTLLVADPYDATRRLFVRYLERCNFHVEEAANRRDAIANIAGASPAVIVSDLALRLQGDPGIGQIPMIVMAGAIRQLDVPTSVALAKPFPLSALLEAVRRALRSAADQKN